MPRRRWARRVRCSSHPLKRPRRTSLCTAESLWVSSIYCVRVFVCVCVCVCACVCVRLRAPLGEQTASRR